MDLKPKVLIVDDKPQNLYAMQKLLHSLDVEIIQAASGAEALGLAMEHDFCVAIMDVQMPEMDGYELLELLRGNERTSTLPAIFVSAIYSDEYHHRKGYEAGAVDFLSKPFAPEILLSKVKVFIDLYTQRHNLQDLVKQLNKRAVQLETSNEVGRQIAGILDVEKLLAEIVKLIQARFGYYFVGIWLLNEAQDMLILQASSEAKGRLAPGFSIPISAEKSINALVCRTGQPHQAEDVSTDTYFMATEGLERTRSELVLPLKFPQILMGSLDIQSDRLNAFGPDDRIALQTMADQISVAIRNARLYSQVVRFNEHLETVVQQRTAELQKANEILEQMDKAKSSFISIAAHELRTPLTLVRGYAGMLQSMVSNQPEAQSMVNGIISGEDRLLEVVNSMLDISKIDNEVLKASKELTHLAHIIAQVSASFHQALKERNLTLNIIGLESLPVVEADPELMQKLFMHLLANAIKFTPDGGQVTVDGKLIPPGEMEDFKQPMVQISIADTGIGIDPAAQELIFEKFYQTGPAKLHSSSKTKFKGGGPGLGLAIARGIVNVHGGHIWVESPGYDEKALPGSTFCVVLPVSTAK